MSHEHWISSNSRQLLERLKVQTHRLDVPRSYHVAVSSKDFINEQRHLQAKFPSAEPAVFEHQLRRLKLGLHELIPFTIQTEDRTTLIVCQYDEATGEAIAQSDLIVGHQDTERQIYFVDRPSFNFRQVNMLGRQAAILAEAELVPLPPSR